MKLAQRLIVWTTVLVLAACGGGGGDAGSNTFGSGSGSSNGNGSGSGSGSSATATASDLVLVLSSASMANNGSQPVTATAIALDAKRNALPGVAVTISVDSDAVATTTGTVTDLNGSVAASIGLGGNLTNRVITVTAASGALKKTAQLQVVDAVSAATPTAADLSLTLSAASLNNAGSVPVVATATAVDRNRNALPGIPITISVDSSAVAIVSGATTNNRGVVSADVLIGADRSNRIVTVTATSGTLTRSASFRVIGAKLNVSLATMVDTGSENNKIEYTLVDTNSNPMVGQAVSVTSPGLPTATGNTDLNGKFVYTFTAPPAAGTVTVLATAAGDSRTDSVSVQNPGNGAIAPAPERPGSGSVSPTPSVVTVNTAGSTSNQVELRALFLGAENRAVPRVRVRFDLDGNLNSSDGVVSWLGGNYAYSDSTGVARGTFTPGLRSSPTNGITIRACYDTVDFALNTCPNAARATLTVTSEALAVSIRTNEFVKDGASQLTYIKEFVVMVVDSAGQAKSDIVITPSVDLPSYYKGFWEWSPPDEHWIQWMTLASDQKYQWNADTRAWEKVASSGGPACPNEDINRNGVREAAAVFGATPALASREEDLNWNGDLDPRKSDVAIKMVGSNKTDANGLAIVQIEYGRDLASWVDFVITVTASGISGTEARARYSGILYGVGNLPFPDLAVIDASRTPAFVVSPYGRGTASFVRDPLTNLIDPGSFVPSGVCTDTR